MTNTDYFYEQEPEGEPNPEGRLHVAGGQGWEWSVTPHSGELVTEEGQAIPIPEGAMLTFYPMGSVIPDSFTITDKEGWIGLAMEIDRTFYEWKPQPDITAYELALCLPVLLHNDSTGVLELPPEAQRHFEQIEDDEP